MSVSNKLSTINDKLLVIVGETGSGKSALAMQLAEQFNGEIICADSWTVYKGFNIGTAKPTANDRRRIKHHLLDIADPEQGFSAPEFKERAIQAIDESSARSKLPIMSGGTGLYVDSVIFDYGFLPAGEAGMRTTLSGLPLEALIEQLQELGLDTAGIDLRNKRRVIRLIETNGQRPERHDLRKNTLIIGLKVPRDELAQRIGTRVDTMLAAGLETEVRQLVVRYGWEVEPMKGIGYQEFREYFAGTQPLEETRARIIKSTLDLAKRQRTWFKRNKDIQWVEEQIEAVGLVTTFLNT